MLFRSLLQSCLAWVNVRHEHFSARHFSGLAGEVDYIWSLTDKLRIDWVARRDLASWWTAASSYRIDDTLSVAPVWRMSEKTALRLRAERVHSDFRGPVLPLTGPLRSDTAQLALVGVEWAALRSLTLDASLQRQRRSSKIGRAHV